MDYIVVDDCGNSDEVYSSLAAARVAREEILKRSGYHHMGDHIHVAQLNYIPNPGAWKYEQDGVVYFARSCDEEKINRLYDYGMLDYEPEWVPTYEWSR